MKTVASLLAGTALAVTMLLGGVSVVSAVLIPQEEVTRFTGLDVNDLWTLTPVRVDPAKQTYERLPPDYGSKVVITDASPSMEEPTNSSVASVVSQIDLVETAAILPDGDEGTQPDNLSPDHVAWCHARYRSYSPDDNSYVTYGGDLRTCVSPHLAESADGNEQPAEALLVQTASPETASVSTGSAHAQNCFKRYRSYRPEDNSYQPYGGGPRKQCELRSF